MSAMTRFIVVVLSSVWLSLCSPWAAAEQAYPSKPIRFVVPYPPGGVGDVLARALGMQLAQKLGQPVIVDNKPGASQMIGAEAVAKSEPDGYTLYLGSLSSLVLNVGSYKKLSYDPIKDFAPVSLFFSTPLYLVVNQNLPVHSVAELIAYGKAHPGQLSFGSIGRGSSVHLTGEIFKEKTGVDMLHVPYKGSVPAETDLVGGQIQLMFDGGTSALPLVRGGKLRVLGVTSAQRASSTPDVPTIAESGVPGFDVSSWFGIVAPAKTPSVIVKRLSSEINEILKGKAFRDRFQTNGIEIAGSTPEEMTARIKADLPKWGQIQRQAGIKPE
ncbi:MAG: tripartite tricarboxylate transporter substrate binding protein [Rhodoferax sp.]